jgi:hypothetical protein
MLGTVVWVMTPCYFVYLNKQYQSRLYGLCHPVETYGLMIISLHSLKFIGESLVSNLQNTKHWASFHPHISIFIEVTFYTSKSSLESVAESRVLVNIYSFLLTYIQMLHTIVLRLQHPALPLFCTAEVQIVLAAFLRYLHWYQIYGPCACLAS